MTDGPVTRLWPLALMGWLAAMPISRDAAAQPVGDTVEAIAEVPEAPGGEGETTGPGQAWLRSGGQNQALTPEPRARRRRRRPGPEAP